MVMKRISPWVLGVLAGGWLIFSGENAHAQAQFELGARLGYGLPFGALDATPPGGSDSSERMRRLLVGQVPLWLDVGVRLQQQFFIGGYVQYGIGILPKSVSDACNTLQSDAAAVGGSSTCKGFDTRLGAEFLYHLMPAGEVDPWLGVGIGYEWAGQSFGFDAQGQSYDVSVSAHGFEFVNLQAGVDIPATETVGIGPFLMLTLAEYSNVSASCSGSVCTQAGFTSDISQEIKGKALHEWLIFGARGTFRL
jgi:hypothetical protein